MTARLQRVMAIMAAAMAMAMAMVVVMAKGGNASTAWVVLPTGESRVISD
jgi:hypothetical protein